MAFMLILLVCWAEPQQILSLQPRPRQEFARVAEKPEKKEAESSQAVNGDTVQFVRKQWNITAPQHDKETHTDSDVIVHKH